MFNSLYDEYSRWFALDANGKPRGSIYFYSDTHFADKEMKYLRKNYIGDEEQVKKINSKIGKYDTFVMLGDVGNKDNIPEALEFVKKIRGYKVLIMGNHDKGESLYKRVIKIIQCSVKVPTTITGGDYNDYLKRNREAIINDFKKRFSGNREYTLVCGSNSYPVFDSTIDGFVEELIYNVEYDNHLFDEVFTGPLTISDRIILSHEPLPDVERYGWFNIHGHDHSGWDCVDDFHLNVCAEIIDYTPQRFKDILASGKLNKFRSLHRRTIDRATERKARKQNKG